MKTFKAFLQESRQVLHIDRKEHPELWSMVKKVGYTGQKLQVSPFEGPKRLTSYWSGGEKDDWYFYELDSGKTGKVEQNGTIFDKKNYEISKLPNNVALINIHRGGYAYAHIYFRPDQITKMLPKPSEDITKNEHIVIYYTKTRIPKARYSEANRVTGINQSDWDAAKQSVIDKGFLTKTGAVTTKGKNVKDFRKEDY